MNLDEKFEEGIGNSEKGLLSRLVKNRWVRRGILCVITVASVLYGDARADDVDKESKLRDLRKASYPELGLTNSGINLGYWHKRTGLRLSHYYLNKEHNEIMLNLGYKLKDNGRTQRSINLMAGRIVGSDPGADYDYAYIGIAYGLNFSIRNISGFFFELGAAKVLEDNLGNLADDPFVPCANIGYIYRFTPKEKK